MVEKEVALLKGQIARLGEKKFELEAWKNQTLIFLERIFGKENSKTAMIRNLHYDYSSWSLRDASGSGKVKNPVLVQAEEILEAAITELEQLGLPGQARANEQVWKLLEDELPGRQMKEIETLARSENPDKTEEIAKILETISKERLAKMIASLVTA